MPGPLDNHVCLVDKSDRLFKFWCGEEVSARNQNVHPAVTMWIGLEICGQLSQQFEASDGCNLAKEVGCHQ